MYAVSPLRYPGAKWRLEKFVSAILRDNKLEGGPYVEPYAGGASLALSLLIRGFVSEIHLNDLDRSVYAFWKTVTQHSHELIDRIRATPITMDSWHTQQAVQDRKQTASISDLGFSTFFLNRTNRSGLLIGGVIGGKQQTGRWKIDARFNKDNLIKRIEHIAAFRSRVHVTRMNALTFVRRCNSSLPRKSFIYLDPPYYVKGRDLYLNAYEPKDHADIAHAVVHELKRPWMVSYDDVPEIHSLYRKATQQPYVLRYSAGKRRKGNEVMFLSPSLKFLPELLFDA